MNLILYLIFFIFILFRLHSFEWRPMEIFPSIRSAFSFFWKIELDLVFLIAFNADFIVNNIDLTTS
jgi:hypothetical protein